MCKEGACLLEIKPGKLDSQVRGDCVRQDCDVTGNVVTLEDPSDFYNDGKICTVDICVGSSPQSFPLPDGFSCPGGGSGYCYNGACVECIDDLPGANDCGGGQVCDYIYCVPTICGANSLCGDQCKPCAAGFVCDQDEDCKDQVCSPQGMCALSTCSDSKKNDSETDVDCGGMQCVTKCGDGKGCAMPGDCESGVCWVGVCQAPTCSDGVKNGGETAIDCGGTCEACP
jgi:hypothetical protein